MISIHIETETAEDAKKEMRKLLGERTHVCKCETLIRPSFSTESSLVQDTTCEARSGAVEAVIKLKDMVNDLPEGLRVQSVLDDDDTPPEAA